MKVKAAGLFLVNKEDKILVGHVTHQPKSVWSIPKGKIDKGETPLSAAIRETYEETNVKLFKDLHDFVYIGKYVYRHKKKDIMIYAHFETEHANWDAIDIRCNSNVAEERGGFPEMDDFKWVTIDEARNLLHKTQVDALDILEENIYLHRGDYDVLWCSDCEKFVHHRKKLSAVMTGHRVCYKCSRMNPVCVLTKVGDDSFNKVSSKIKFFEFSEDGLFKAEHNKPKVGYTLIMSPFGPSFTWHTTPITQIIEKGNNKPRKYLKFKTKNSTYELYYHTL